MSRLFGSGLAALVLACAVAPAASQTKTTFSYDVLGRLTRSSDDAGRAAVYRYDAAGNRLSLSNGAAKGEILPVAFLASSKLGGAGVPSLDGMHDLIFNEAGSAHLTGVDALAFITADLGIVKILDHVDLAAPDRALAGGGIAALNDAQLQSSQDGLNWSSVSQVSGVVAGVYKTIALNGIQARYVRISKSGASLGVGDFRLYAEPKDANRAPTAVEDSRTKLNAGDSVTLDPRSNDEDLDHDTLTVTAVSPAVHGQTRFTGSSVTYVPDAGYVGEDSFAYTIIDDRGGFSTALVKVKSSTTGSGSDGNRNPIAVDDGSATSRFAIPYAAGVYTPPIDILANDSDPDGDPLTVTVTNGKKGLVDFFYGKARYFPQNGVKGSDEFTYTLSDDRGGSATATVWVKIIGGENTEPTIRPDAVETRVGEPVTIYPLANDEDEDGDTLTISWITNPSHGQADLIDHRYVIYTPNTGFSGSDTFTYSAADGHGGYINGVVTIDVYVPVPNTAPIARDDFSADAPADIAYGASAVPFRVLDNDNDPDGDPLTIRAYSQPPNGTVNRVGETLTYTPNAGFSGPDSFTYDIKDGKGGYAAAAVYVKVRNNPATLPTPRDDGPFHVRRGVTTTFTTLLANDTAPNGGALTIESVGQALHGSAIRVNDTTVTYGAPINYAGPERFSYTVSDANGGTATAWVDLIIDVNEAPIARDDVAEVAFNTATAINVLANDSDPNNDRLSVRGAGAPAHGSTTFNDFRVTYTPAPGYVGGDSFTYKIDDNEGGFATATVTVNVAADTNKAPIAVNDGSFPTVVNTARSIDVLANDSDPDGDPLTIQSVTQPAHGAAVIAAGKITYTPSAGYVGPDSFGYTIWDGKSGFASGTVSITVQATDPPPIAVDDTATTAFNSATTIAVLANDHDPDGDTLTITGATAPAHGSVVIASGQITYTPTAGYSGPDSFVYTISDGRGASASASVSITVGPKPNEAPTTVDDSAAIIFNTAKAVAVLANDRDPDGDVLTISAVTAPAHGTAAITGGQITYTPHSGYSGPDSFGYTVSDGRGGTASANVSLAVGQPGPVAVDDGPYWVAQRGVAQINVLANDYDVEGRPLSLAAVGAPAHGEASLRPGGIVYYQPAAGYGGPDSLTYMVLNDQGRGANAIVRFNVESPSNHDPVAVYDGPVVVAPGETVTIPVLANDYDLDGDTLSLETVTNSSSLGQVSMVNGAVRYTAPNDLSRTQGIVSYTISDGHGGEGYSSIEIRIQAGYSVKPIANDDGPVWVTRGQATSIAVLANDSAPAGYAPMRVVAVSQGARGQVAHQGETALTYTPNSIFPDGGEDRFTYTVANDWGGRSTATVRVMIPSASNRSPRANSDTAWAATGSATTIDVLANDSDPDGDPLTLTSVQASEGSAQISGGKVIYTPPSGAGATTNLTYTVHDGRGGFATTSVLVRFGTVPAEGPTLVDDGPYDVPYKGQAQFDILSNDRGPRPAMNAVLIGQPAHGSVTTIGNWVTYSATDDYSGPDSFTYVTYQGAGVGRVSVQVGPRTNRPPVTVSDSMPGSGGIDVAFNRSVTIPVLANDSDPDGDKLSIASVTAPGHGQAVIVGDTVVYTPTPGFSGFDNFAYQASDGRGGLTTQNIGVRVAANAAPVAYDDLTNATAFGTPIAIRILANDTDADNDPLTATISIAPGAGTVQLQDGVATYTPRAGFSGYDEFTYTVADPWGYTASALVRVTISAAGLPTPIARDDGPIWVSSSGGTFIYPLLNDQNPSGGPVTIVDVGRPARGGTNNMTSMIQYISPSNYGGPDSFTYVIANAQGGRATATVYVNVKSPTNANPAANDDGQVFVRSGSSLTIDVLANDTDINGDALTITKVDPPASGATAVIGGGGVIYTGKPGWSGSDSFTYTIGDGKGGFATATVRLYVGGS